MILAIFSPGKLYFHYFVCQQLIVLIIIFWMESAIQHSSRLPEQSLYLPDSVLLRCFDFTFQDGISLSSSIA